jgi:hypothetical protein
MADEKYFERNGKNLKSEGAKSKEARPATPIIFPRTRTPVRHCRPLLVGDEIREEVGEYSKQR